MPANDMPALAERFNAAMNALDLTMLADLYAEDIIVWHSHDEIEQNKIEALAAAEAFFSRLASCRCEITAIHLMEAGFVQQHRLVGTTSSGKPFRGSPLCVIVSADDAGQIRRLDEYIGLKPLSAPSAG